MHGHRSNYMVRYELKNNFERYFGIDPTIDLDLDIDPTAWFKLHYIIQSFLCNPGHGSNYMIIWFQLYDMNCKVFSKKWDLGIDPTIWFLLGGLHEMHIYYYEHTT